MKTWNFQVNSSPKESSKKLETALGGTKIFVLNMNYDKKNFVQFKIRKRVLLAFELNTQNNIIVNGKIFKTDANNETDVEISFTQHPVSKLLIYGNIILGLSFLAAMILEFSTNSYIYIIAGILLVIGILFGLQGQKEFDKNVQEYKTLISEIFEF